MLQAPIATAWKAADEAFALIDQQIVLAEALTYPSADDFAATTRHIDAQFALIDQVFNVLATELRTRESAAGSSLLTMALSLAALGVVGAWILILVARTTTRSLSEAVRVAQAVARGDLTSDSIDTGARDEAGQLLRALQDMNGSLVRIVSEVRQGSDHIVTGSSQIATGNADLSQSPCSKAPRPPARPAP